MARPALLATALLLLAVSASAAAPAPAPSPTDDPCFEPLISNLLPCVDYVSPGNTSVPPVKSDCCNGLGDFFTKTPNCTCFLLKVNLTEFGFGDNVDRAKALALPSQCKKKLPEKELEKCLGPTASDTTKKCFPAVAEQLIPCAAYVDPASNKTSPSPKSSCCKGVSSFLTDRKNCLCALINANTSAFPIPLDRGKVLLLPGACNAPLPSFKCTGDVTSDAPPNPCLAPVVNNLAPCVKFVEPNAGNATPARDGDCCRGVRAFVANETSCVCSILSAKPGDYPINVDQSKAVELASSSCRANISLLSQCFAESGGSPATAPSSPGRNGAGFLRASSLATAAVAVAAAFL